MEITTLSNRGVRWIRSNWDNFNFDMSIQRKSGLWNKNKKTMLIHTLIAKYPTNAIFAVDIGDKKYEFIEGKQRMTTVKEYLEDDFSLTEEILTAPQNESIDLEELVGKKFSELDEEYQARILDYSFQYKIISEATEEEIEEVMFRLNQGTPMSTMELINVKAGKTVRDFLKEMASTEFFAEQIAFSASDRQRFIDQQKVLEVVSHIMGEEFDFNSKNLKNFALSLKEEIPYNVVSKTIDVLKYLANAFRDSVHEVKGYVPELKKVHVIGVVANALENMDSMDAQNFGDIVLTFLKEQSNLRLEHKKDENIGIGRYNEACDKASAKRDNIEIRIDEMKLFFEEKLEEEIEE